MSIITQIDRCLKRYYDKNGKTDYFDRNDIGKFKTFCDDNGFDDDFVEQEITESVDDCQLLEFDEAFPFIEKPEDEATAIYRILKMCVENSNAFSDELVRFKPLEITKEDWNTSDIDLDQTKRLYCSQLVTIFNNEMQSDKNVLKVLTIGRKKDAPYLQYLTDMYFRDRIADGELTSVTKWASKNKYMQLLLNSNEFGKIVQETAKTSVESFFQRICPILLLSPLIRIEDSLYKVSQYILEMARLTYVIARENNESCPFQADYCIIFSKVSFIDNMVTEGIDAVDEEDDTEDDDDDEDEDEVKHNDLEFFDCIGDICEKLSAEQLMYMECRDRNIDGQTISSRFPHHFKEFKNSVISGKYKGAEFMQYPRNKRFVAVVDRRKKDEEKASNVDSLIFFEPPDNCNTLPNAAVPEWFFDSSRTCIIPNIGYQNGKNQVNIEGFGSKRKEKLKKQTFVSTADCNGALMVLSMHVISSEEIKCYMYLNGKVTRFFPSDIVNLLPLYFNMDIEKNREFVKGKEAQDIIERMTPKLRDYKFESFYKSWQ